MSLSFQLECYDMGTDLRSSREFSILESTATSSGLLLSISAPDSLWIALFDLLKGVRN